MSRERSTAAELHSRKHRHAPRSIDRSPSYSDHEHSDSQSRSDDAEDDADVVDHNRKSKRRKVQSQSQSKPPDEKKEKIKFLHWQLRKACRQAYEQGAGTFEDDSKLFVVLGEQWQYSYDHSVPDESIVGKNFHVHTQLLHEIHQQVYHSCIVTNTGEKFKTLLRSQDLDNESQTRNLEQLCVDGFTKPERIGGKIKKNQYMRLCELYRTLVTEQLKTTQRKCFKDLLQFEHGKKKGAGGVIQNPGENLSDASKYSEQWKWLATCAIKNGRPVPVHATTVVCQHETDSEISQIVATVKDYVAKYALMDGLKIKTLWQEMVNAVLEITAREMVPDSIESMVRHDAEQSFESFLVNDLFKKRDQDPNWFPTPTEKTAHRVHYNLRHRRTETVQKKYEKALSAKVDEARDNLEDNLAHVGQSLLVALEHGIDGHSFLAFYQGRIVPRKDIQLDDPIPIDDADHAVTGIGSPERPHKDTVNDEGVPDIDEVRRGEQEMEEVNTARSGLELGTEGVNDV